MRRVARALRYIGRRAAGPIRMAPQGVAFVLAVGMSAGVGAQAPSGPPGDADPVVQEPRPDTVRTGRVRFVDPDDGPFDLSHFLESPRGFLPIQIVLAEPAVGCGGAAGMFLRPRNEAGDEGWAWPDISAVGAFGTQNGTWGPIAGDASRWLHGHLRTLFGAATGRANLDFHGLGGDGLSLDQKQRCSPAFTGMIVRANWQLVQPSPWALGLR
jgi:hypothetical protein